MSVEQLSANRGESFLRLFRNIMPDVPPSSDVTNMEAVYVPYQPLENQLSVWESDSENATPALKHHILWCRASRTLFLTAALLEIFCAFVSDLFPRILMLSLC